MVSDIRYWVVVTFVSIVFVNPQKASAWGPEGHKLVLEIAMKLLKPDVKNDVLAVLDTMSLNTAANWMDIVRANSEYDFMKTWHYIDFAADQQYHPSTDENIVNRLIITFNELRHKNILCSQQIKMDVLILCHLVGDLHQPLHTGYVEDLGGNKRPVQYDTLKTNLHHFWDEDIIRLAHITLADCLTLYDQHISNPLDTIEGIHPAGWMKETRTLLPQVYGFTGFELDSQYVSHAAPLVTRQLLIAGIRLAAIFNKLFVSTAPILNMQEVTAKYKHGIDAKDAAANIGKNVTACGRVYGIKETDNVTFINVGDRYPNSPLTVVIFKKDRNKFQGSMEELFADKNICITGEVVAYKGKAEIIIIDPKDVIIQ